jgi:vacuolar-type H+-ATPase subunit E/Vma4
MGVSPFLVEAVGRLLEAEHRIEAAQASASDTANLREALRALHDYARALEEINQYTTEMLKERLDAMQAKVELGNRLLSGSTACA